MIVESALFINSETHEKHWLFGTNDYLIVNQQILTAQDSTAPEQKKPAAILYVVVKEDTNQDARLSREDQQTIGLSLPSGKDYREVLVDIDELLGQRLVDPSTLLLVYQKQGVGYAANANLAGFALSNEEPLPKPGP